MPSMKARAPHARAFLLSNHACLPRALHAWFWQKTLTELFIAFFMANAFRVKTDLFSNDLYHMNWTFTPLLVPSLFLFIPWATSWYINRIIVITKTSNTLQLRTRVATPWLNLIYYLLIFNFRALYQTTGISLADCAYITPFSCVNGFVPPLRTFYEL